LKGKGYETGAVFPLRMNRTRSITASLF